MGMCLSQVFLMAFYRIPHICSVDFLWNSLSQFLVAIWLSYCRSCLCLCSLSVCLSLSTNRSQTSTVNGDYFLLAPSTSTVLTYPVERGSYVERGSSMVECRTRDQVNPGSNPPLLPFRRLGIFVLSIDAPVHSAV